MKASRVKRALLHYPVLNVGGAEMSVTRMITALLNRGWQVDLVVTTGGGSLESSVDSRARLIRLRDRAAGARYKSSTGLFDHIRHLPDLLEYFLTRCQQLIRSLSFLFRQYDFAAVCLHGLSPGFCIHWVRADKYLHWMRNDLENCDSSGKAHRNIDRYAGKINHYICVSNWVRETLVKKYPELAPKAVVIRNIVDPTAMLKNADAPADLPVSQGRLKVLTVCRLHDKSKGLMRMARVQRRLLDQGMEFDWYIVGEGPDRNRLEKYLIELKLQDRLFLLGARLNPFPYYRWADIVAVLSNFEGLCGVVNEAKIMGKPVVATRFSGIDEQIVSEQNGLIVENDEDSIVAGLGRLLEDDHLRQSITNDCLPTDIKDDEFKLRQLEQLVS